MSIVGPRPQMKVDFERFPEHVQRVIYNVRPGITGLGSIVFRDEERLLSQPGIDPVVFYTEKIAPYKGELEIWYQQHASLWLDIKLIFMTVKIFFQKEVSEGVDDKQVNALKDSGNSVKTDEEKTEE